MRARAARSPACAAKRTGATKQPTRSPMRRSPFANGTAGTPTAPSTSNSRCARSMMPDASLVRVIRALPERAPERGKVALLSKAEKRVLLLAAGGATSKEIAAELGRSSQTVDVHIRSICRKLGVSGRRQAVVAAIRQGLIAERRSR